MTVRTIVKMGHPALASPAQPVTPETVPDLPNLLVDMADSMNAVGGVGLAAPQIAEQVRVIIFKIPEERVGKTPEDTPQALQVLINPEIEPVGAETQVGWEGCLSLPGMCGEVSRHARIRYWGLDGKGNRIEREVTGFHARVIQHEIDHLDGILYPQRMTDMSRFGYVDEMSAATETASRDLGQDDEGG